jgi:hypothetical protein
MHLKPPTKPPVQSPTPGPGSPSTDGPGDWQKTGPWWTRQVGPRHIAYKRSFPHDPETPSSPGTGDGTL